MFSLPDSVNKNISFWVTNVLHNSCGSEWPNNYSITRGLHHKFHLDDLYPNTDIVPIAICTECTIYDPCQKIINHYGGDGEYIDPFMVKTYALLRQKGRNFYFIDTNETRPITRRLCHTLCTDNDYHCQLQEMRDSIRIQIHRNKTNSAWTLDMQFMSEPVQYVNMMHFKYTRLNIGVGLEPGERRKHESTQNNDRRP